MIARRDWQAPFRHIASELSWADLTIANLECALTRRYPPPEDPYTLRFLSYPDALAGLQLAGIDAVSLANNHSMDFGWLALQDTKEALAAAGIACSAQGSTSKAHLNLPSSVLGHRPLHCWALMVSLLTGMARPMSHRGLRHLIPSSSSTLSVPLQIRRRS